MLTRPARAIFPALALGALAAGCLEREGEWERPRSIIGPIPLGDRAAYVDGARDQIVVVTADPDDPDVLTYEIGRRAAHAAPAPDGEHLAVISWGDDSLEGDADAEGPALWYVDTTDPEAEPTGYPLGSYFDRVAVAEASEGEDGPVAVAYGSAEAARPGGVLHNPNEIAIAHLGDEPGEGNPERQSARAFGAAPEGVILSPPMRIAGHSGAPRVFAFVLAENAIAIFDTQNPHRGDVAVELADTGDDVLPRDIAFEPEAGVAYIRSEGARDVLEIDLQAKAPAAEGENDYRPALAELGAGSGPADIEVYESEEGERRILAAMPSAREIALIDAGTGEFRTVSTPDPVDRIVLFPRGGETPRVALLASISADVDRAHLLDLEDLDDELAPARLAPVSLDRPVADVAAVPGRELGLLVHDDSRTVLGLLDVGTGVVTPIQGVERLEHYDFADGGTHLVTAAEGPRSVGFLDLDSLHPSEMRLDAPPERAHAMEGGSIFVDHGDPFGMATILPGAEAERSEARVLSGFLLEGALDHEF